MNDEIRSSPIRLISPEGEQLGVVKIDEARTKASQYGLDLVEVAPQARPPVVRIMDYGKFRYELKKKEREQRKRARAQADTKEMKFRPATEEHDFEFKLRHIRDFLESGRTVRITVRYRGRELRQPEPGFELLDRIVEETKDIAHVENRNKKIEGRQLQMTLEPGSET